MYGTHKSPTTVFVQHGSEGVTFPIAHENVSGSRVQNAYAVKSDCSSDIVASRSGAMNTAIHYTEHALVMPPTSTIRVCKIACV